MARRVLFVLRGKLGDTVTAFATVRAHADAFPDDELTMLVRANYAPLFAAERGLRVIGFRSRLGMFAKLAWMRLREAPFGALLVLLGAGPPIERLGRLVRARRKVYLDARFRAVYPEWPEIPAHHGHFEPAWRVAKCFEPALPAPRQATIPSLAAARRPGTAIGIAPVSDEPRRTMGLAATIALVDALRASRPGAPIHLLLNPADADARTLLAHAWPAGVELRRFDTLERLVEELSVLAHLHSTDTGTYHLAAAMGVPLTVYFGPTQPWKNAFATQPAVTRIRIEALGGEHCEVKDCRRPVCLEIPVALASGRAPVPYRVEDTPAGCLLRRLPAEAIERVRAQGPAADPPGEPSTGSDPVH